MLSAIGYNGRNDQMPMRAYGEGFVFIVHRQCRCQNQEEVGSGICDGSVQVCDCSRV